MLLKARSDATKADSLFRESVDRRDRFPLINNIQSNVDLVFFAPLNGQISQTFDPSTKHFAVDIVIPKNTPVKATADGRVLFASWTSDASYVIIIDHGEELISVYKHNSSLTKVQGDFVKSREVIAISGSSGELSTGPHLHFELWNNGIPLNPTTFIDF